eukprot:s1322_g2.t2
MEEHRLLSDTCCSDADEEKPLEWLELLSASNTGEKERIKARTWTRKCRYLQAGAQQHHVQMCRGQLKEAVNKLMADVEKFEDLLKGLETGVEDSKHIDWDKVGIDTKHAILERLQTLQAFSEQDASLDRGRAHENEPTHRVERFTQVADCIEDRTWCKDRARKLLPDGACYELWVRMLNALTPTEFVRKVTVLSMEEGQETLLSFIHGLSLELPYLSAFWALKDGPDGKGDRMTDWATDAAMWQWKRGSTRGFHIIGHGHADIYRTPMQGLQEKTKQLLEFEERDCWISSQTLSSKTTFCITPTVRLLDDDISNNDLGLILKALVDTGPFSYSFVTPVGRAVLELASDRTWYVRRLHAFKDISYVVMLMFMGHARRQGRTCDTWVIMAFIGLAILVAFNFFAKLFVESILITKADAGGWLRFFDLRAALVKHATTWNGLVVCSEIYSVYVTMRFVRFWWHLDVSTDPQQYWDFFENDPSALSSLVLIRWTILSTNFLQIEQVGSNMVPVVLAVCQPASIFFLLFLGFMITAAFHAYYVFPIQENVGGSGVLDADYLNHVLTTFLKVFRLAVLGDFDLNELEGINEHIEAKIVHTDEIKGKVEVPEEEYSSKYHRTIRYEFVVLSLVITVVVMNVYIGLLGELYEKAERRCRQHYNNYRASCAYRHICEHYAFAQVFCCCRKTKPASEKEGLYWLSYSKTKLFDNHESET